MNELSIENLAKNIIAVALSITKDDSDKYYIPQNIIEGIINIQNTDLTNNTENDIKNIFEPSFFLSNIPHEKDIDPLTIGHVRKAYEHILINGFDDGKNPISQKVIDDYRNWVELQTNNEVILKTFKRDNLPDLDNAEIINRRATKLTRQDVINKIAGYSQYYPKDLRYYDLTDVDLSSIKCYEDDCPNEDIEIGNYTIANVFALDFTGANLTRTNFNNSHLHYPIFTGAILNETSIVNSALVIPDFSECILDNVDFSKSILYNPYDNNDEGSIFSNVKIINCDFTDSDLEDAKFTNALIEKCEFVGSILDNVDFMGSKINNSNLWAAIEHENVNFFLTLVDNVQINEMNDLFSESSVKSDSQDNQSENESDNIDNSINDIPSSSPSIDGENGNNTVKKVKKEGLDRQK